jgi:hypothetical protein
MIPGAIVTTRMPYCARSRAAGNVRDAMPPFVDDDSALAFGVRSGGGDGFGGERQHIERSDQIDPHDSREQIEIVHAGAPEDPG